MKTNKSQQNTDRRRPYLFAYDISDEKRARKVRRCLQRWRVDGQYSVHETYLIPYEAQALTSEIVYAMDRDQDRLLVGRLSRRGSGPVCVLSQSLHRAQLAGIKVQRTLPAELHDGWYLIAYDVTDPARLQRVQHEAAKHCTFTQRSVYLFHGKGHVLHDVLAKLAHLIKQDQDDLRLYSLNGGHDLWFPSGPLPPLAGLANQGENATDTSLWQRMMNWLKAA